MLSNRNKKSKKWCIILNPIESELHKSDAIEKIAEIFPLSLEEASQLVERTPIILLEDLVYEKALAVKEHFAAVNVNILMTDDVFQKRKCYRTVWPQDPLKKLDSLLAKETVSVSDDDVRDFPMPTDMRVLSKEEATMPAGTTREEEQHITQRIDAYETALNERDAVLQKERNEKEKLFTEIDHLKKEIYGFRHNANLQEQTNNEFQYLSLELEKTKEVVQQQEREIAALHKAQETSSQGDAASADAVHQELAECKKIISEHAEEKKALQSEVAVLKETVAEAASAEKHLAELQHNYDVVCKQLTQLQKLESVAGEKEAVEKVLQQLQDENTKLRESEQAYATLKDRYAYLEKEVKNFSRTKSLLEDSEQQRVQSDNAYRAIKEQFDSVAASAQQEVATLREEVAALRHKNASKDEEVNRVTDEKGKLKALLQDFQKDNEELREVKRYCDELEKKYSSLEKQLVGHKHAQTYVDELEKKCRALEKQCEMQMNNFVVECEKHNAALKNLEDKYAFTMEQKESQTRDFIAQSSKDKSCIQAWEERYEQLVKKTEIMQREWESEAKEYEALKEECEGLRKNARVLEEKLKIFDRDKQELFLQLQEGEGDRIRFLEMQKLYDDLQTKYTTLRTTFDNYRLQKDEESKKHSVLIEEQKKIIRALEEKVKMQQRQNEVHHKTIRDLTTQREEQETAKRRIQLQQEIAEKERALQGLLKEQEVVESEIAHKEDKRKNFALEREALQKEIVRMKQDQKHLFEKAKMKERQRFAKLASHHATVAPAQSASVSEVPAK